MKKFLISAIIIMLINCNVKADVSCYGLETYNHYLFKILEKNQSEDFGYMKFWIDYTGANQAVSSYDLSYSVENIENDVKAGSSTNAILQTAILKKDNEMIAYLKDLSKYLNINDDLYNQWDYPSEEQIRSMLSEYEKILDNAKKYNGTRLKDRYRLMTMRCMFQLEKYSELEKYWLAEGIKTQDEYCKKTMTGLFAGALYKQKKVDSAINIFMQIGDLQSVKFCLDEKRNFQGIKERYNKDKNDASLIFLVEDFVNMFQENIDDEYSRPYDFRGIEMSNAKEFVSFANNIADQKASKTPLMWKTAAAIVSYYLGDVASAQKYINETSSLEGTQRMKDVTRVIKFFIETKAEKYSPAKAAYYESELKWLETKARDEMYFENARDRIIVHNILPSNDKNTFGILVGTTYNFNKLYEYSTKDLENYLSFISQPKKMNSLEKWLLDKSNVKTEEVYETLGTKYLGEMDFDKAEEYLSKVTPLYYNGTFLARYMSLRDYNVKRWVKTQDWIDDWYDDSQSTTKTNQKLDFCREIKALTTRFNSSTGDQHCETAQKLATLYSQASRWGNCWYLLEYSWSVYGERTPAQTAYENKALEYLDVAAKSTVDSIKYDSYYAKVWFLWHDYQYYYDYGEQQEITSRMNTAMADLKNYWDGVYGKNEWSFQCDCIMDYVRTH
ncbi:MAG: hypothetical protein IKR41_09200 [Bacteroidales bacterium]|nr:hypothetical protein [Bacteroidales bacterium]